MYHEKKEMKKKEEEENKRKRAEERQKKKEIRDKINEQKKLVKENNKKIKKLKLKRRDSSTDSESSEEWMSSGGTSDEEFHLNDEPAEVGNCETLQLNGYIENDYVVVAFPGKKRQHKYVCVIQQILPGSEAEVVGMKKCEDGKNFTLNENDISVINLDQIVQKLKFPNMIVSGDRVKYLFHEELIVDG